VLMGEKRFRELVLQSCMSVFAALCLTPMRESEIRVLASGSLAEREAYWSDLGCDCAHFGLVVARGMREQLGREL
jgi:hypothetical protein